MRDLTVTAVRHESPLGTLTLLGWNRGLLRVEFPGTDDQERAAWVRKHVAESATVAWDKAALKGWRKKLDRYFKGRPEPFEGGLDLKGTLFQRAVWEVLREVPWGQTVSYGDLAQRVGCDGGAQAVGQAVHENPLAIVVPCHRVLGADGSLVGFGGGLPAKRYLLALEGALPQLGLFDDHLPG